MPLCLDRGSAAQVRDGRGRRDRGGGSVQVTASRGARTEPPAGQRDSRVRGGREVFPPHPETGGSRNPTGNLAPAEPPSQAVVCSGSAAPPARCIPWGPRCVPAPRPAWGAQSGSGRGQGKADGALPVWGALAGALLPLSQQIPGGGLRSWCRAGGWSGARCLRPGAGDVPCGLLVHPGHRCHWGVRGQSLFLLLLCFPRG